MKQSLIDNAVIKAGKMLSDANKKIETFAPENELNKKTYNRLMDGKMSQTEFAYLCQRYGDDTVRFWIKSGGK